ncbi:PorP/SprF family type IX secretion system membrane protein [Zeaxanthinibacter sp. PT1]|uniref:PorP/SprF family type IX secretion system membrane protein n=1 Tax=Zeaxanthinibacter TaxID=561554 RepID=UPI002349C5E3|nr:PorP/SprF family type IX secretion system membrane protein [Zeaxanthinibacter sp. PT1]MDC6351721.1 PorP/SprF family type IX secretion system membrane protein [Zeaxanthinibacter sp. PT1]
MLRPWLWISVFFAPLAVMAQATGLPADLRQHNLTQYNESLLNPTASLDKDSEQSLALWTRWQWQTIDGDPTTLFFNYSAKLNSASAAGIGFFQHNTGSFIQTGAVLNYAATFNIGAASDLAFGVNLFGFQQEVGDTRFQQNPDMPLPQFDIPNQTLIRLAPSLRYTVNDFSLGLVAENLIDINLSKDGQDQGANNVYTGLASYDIPLAIGVPGTSYLRPVVYIRSLPDADNQVGFTTLLSTSKFWGQLGYNNFYGLSAGAGGRFLKNFSIGALVEFGGDQQLQGNSTTFEFVTAYSFGPNDLRRKVVGFEEEEGEQILLTLESAPGQQEEKPQTQLASEENTDEDDAELSRLEKERQAFIEMARIAEETAQADVESRKKRRQRERDSIDAAETARRVVQQQKVRQEQIKDSLARVREQAALAVARERDQGRPAADQTAGQQSAEVVEEVTRRPGERYEEVERAGGLLPGFYLIANVFGTKKYHDIFVNKLSQMGLDPKSFYRSENEYNYVYLGRYRTIAEARSERDSKMGGKYPDKLWIFRVVGE